MKINHVYIISALLILFITLTPTILEAQCAMCKAVLENELTTDGNRKSEGINAGIIFLMGIPYILIGSAILYYLKLRKSN